MCGRRSGPWTSRHSRVAPNGPGRTVSPASSCTPSRLRNVSPELMHGAAVARRNSSSPYHYDEPLGIAAGFNFHVLSRCAQGSVDVVLTGDGGDELFGGYRRHVAEQLASPCQRLPDVLTRRVVP